MTARQDLVLWGATGQAKVLNELIQDTAWRLVALVDNRAMRSPLPGIPLLLGTHGLDAWLSTRSTSAPRLAGAAAIGGDRGADRLQLMATLAERGIAIVTLVHRTAFVASDSVLAPGCQVLAHASICTHARLGRGVIVNTAASVDHDCVLGDGVHIAPGARLAGCINVGDRAFVGTGAVILPHLTIGAGAIIGAGAVVTTNVPEEVTVMGNPARIHIKN